METTIIKTLEFLKGQSIQVAIVFVAVLILTWLLRNKSAHVRYLLWLLVAVKCLTPPLVIFSVPVLPAETVPVAVPTQSLGVEQKQPPIASDQTLSTEVSEEPAKHQQARQYSIENRELNVEDSRITRLYIPPTKVLLSLWAAGAALYLLWAMAKAIRLQGRLRRIRRPLPPKLMIEQIELLAGLWNYPGGFKVWLVDGITQPFVWGLWRGSIYLPTHFQNIQGDKQKAIVLHEMAHVVRFDAFVNLIQILIQGAFWFHPLVWLANKAIRQEREKCCDEIAVARLGTAPREYGHAIVDTLLQETQSLITIPTLAVAGPVKNIEDRIKTIMQPGRRFFRRPSRIALLVIGLLAVIIIPTTIALTQKITPPDYTLSGSVVDAQTDKPIAGAIVYDDGYGPQPYQKGITDDSGKFEYKSWNEEHNVTAKTDGYRSHTITFTTSPLDNSKSLNFKLQPGTESDKVRDWVKDYFKNNYRDITARKDIEWGEPTTDDNGNISIRYKYEATIWDKDKVTLNEVWTFDRQGKFLYVRKFGAEDIYSPAGARTLVEDFFANNFRDITKRETIEWEPPTKYENGNVSIRYKYEATIWDKDKIINNQIFTFDKNGKYVSVKNVAGFPQKTRVEIQGSEAQIVGLGSGWSWIQRAVGKHYRGSIGGYSDDEAKCSEYFEKVLSWSKPGDTFFLTFAFDEEQYGHTQLVPEQYRDLLPIAWTDLLQQIKQGKTVEAHGQARGLNTIVLAAPTLDQLVELIKTTKLLGFFRISSGQTAFMEFRIVPELGKDISESELQKYKESLDTLGPNGHYGNFRWFAVSPLNHSTWYNSLICRSYKDTMYVLLYDVPDKCIGITGRWGLQNVSVDATDPKNPTILADFDDAGASLFGQLTKQNVGRQLAVIINWKIISAPRIMSPFSKQLAITGSFTNQEIGNLVQALIQGMPPLGAIQKKEEATEETQIKLRMEQLAKTLVDYAQAHGRKFPQQLSSLSKNTPDDLLTWAQNNIIYAGDGIYNNKYGYGAIAYEKKIDAGNLIQGGLFIFNNGMVFYKDDKQANELLLEIKSRTTAIDWTGPGLDEQAAKWEQNNETAYHLMNAEKARTATMVAGPVLVMEKYIKQWPHMLQLIKALNVLGSEYDRLGRSDRAKETFNRAIELAGNANMPFMNILQINLAMVEMGAGEYEQARQRLEKVIAVPVPDSLEDAAAASAQLFIAPQSLAQLYAAQGKEQRADELLKENAQKAIQLFKEYPDIAWIPSYAVAAYQKRVNLLLEKNPPNIPAAYALVDELEKTLPNYQDPFFSAADLRRAIAQYEGMVMLKSGKKTNVKTETRESQNKADQQAATKAEALPQNPQFAAVLPSGVTAELVGVSHYPSEGKPWWSPDGQLLDKAPYTTSGNTENHDKDGYQNYEFALRLQPGDASYMWIIPRGSFGSDTGSARDNNGQQIRMLKSYQTGFPKEQKTAMIRLGVTDGPWQTVAVHKPANREQTLAAGEYSIAFGIPYQKDNETLLPVVHNYNRREKIYAIRVIAMTSSGQTRESGYSGRGSQTLDNLTYSFYDLPIDTVKEFQFQIRPYEWITFNNISLVPGQKTDVKIEIPEELEKTAAKTPEPPVESIKQSPQFTTALPIGLTVELVGICEYPSEGKKWWRPDGSPLEQNITTKDSSHYEDKNKAFEIAYRVTAPAGITVDFPEVKGSTARSGLEVPSPAGLKAIRTHLDIWGNTTTVSFPVTCGPWKTLGFTNGSAQALARVGNRQLLFSQALGTRDKLVITVSDDLKQFDNYRLIAIDKQGSACAADYNSCSVENMRQNTFTFTGLDPATVDHYEFQSRPFVNIEFKNISLKPGKKTNVKIKIPEELEKAVAGKSEPIPVVGVTGGMSDTNSNETSVAVETYFIQADEDVLKKAGIDVNKTYGSFFLTSNDPNYSDFIRNRVKDAPLEQVLQKEYKPDVLDGGQLELFLKSINTDKNTRIVKYAEPSVLKQGNSIAQLYDVAVQKIPNSSEKRTQYGVMTIFYSPAAINDNNISFRMRIFLSKILETDSEQFQNSLPAMELADIPYLATVPNDKTFWILGPNEYSGVQSGTYPDAQTRLAAKRRALFLIKPTIVVPEAMPPQYQLFDGTIDGKGQIPDEKI